MRILGISHRTLNYYNSHLFRHRKLPFPLCELRYNLLHGSNDHSPSLWGAGIFIWLALPINSLNSHRLLQMQVLKTWQGKCKLLCSIEITFQRHEIWMQKGLVQRSVMKIFRNRLNLLLIYFYLSVYSGTLNWCYGDSIHLPR